MIDILKTTLNTEIQALQNIQKSSLDQIVLACESLLDARGKVVFMGIGKSAIVAQKCTATFNSLGIRSSYLHASEAMHGDFGSVNQDDIIFAFSLSGETPEVIKVVNHAKKDGIKIISLTGKRSSSLATISDLKIIIDIEDEGSVHNLAPMASVIAMIAVGDCIANFIAKKKEFTKERFATNHPGGSLGLKLSPISKVYKEKLPLIEETADLKHILNIINESGFGITGVVTDKNNLIGVITDGDVRRAILKKDGYDLTSIDIMTKNPKTIDINQNVFDALEIMEKHKITALFVTKDSKPVGIVHIHDILKI